MVRCAHEKKKHVLERPGRKLSFPVDSIKKWDEQEIEDMEKQLSELLTNLRKGRKAKKKSITEANTES